MKPVSKLFVLLAFVSVFGATTSARADVWGWQTYDQYPVPHNIETRQVTAFHQVNHMVPMASLDTVVYFDTNSSQLTAQDDRKLRDVAATLRVMSHHGHHVAVQGYTDSVGNDAHNQRLSYHRAVQVMNLLVKQYGVPAGMLSAQGFGKENPVADNGTAAGRAMNRRVSFVCTDR